jgi:glycine betaine catabolism A
MGHTCELEHCANGATTRELSPRMKDLLARRRPGWCLERSFYADQEVYDNDIEAVFKRYWLYAGLTLQIPNAGDYFVYDIASESVIITRGKDGCVYALSNVCRHRGSRVCTERSGHANGFVCPYHQWVYDNTGALKSARLMPADFDKASFGLNKIHVREIEGLIFICLAENPPAFDAAEADMLPHLKSQGLTNAKIIHTERRTIRANWKLVVENFRECYHCSGTHPEFCRVMIWASELGSPSIVEEGKKIYAERLAHWQKIGLETKCVYFTRDNWHLVYRAPFTKSAVTQSVDGNPVAPLMGTYTEQDSGNLAITTQPNLWLEASSDHAVVMRMTPLSPTVSEMETRWLVRADAVEGVDYRTDRVTAFWRLTGEQDWKLCEDNQAGVSCDSYRPGPYAPSEESTETFVLWYLDQLTKK